MHFTKRIGNTTYRVKVVVSEEGTETIEDILLRLIRNEALVNDGASGFPTLAQEEDDQIENKTL